MISVSVSCRLKRTKLLYLDKQHPGTTRRNPPWLQCRTVSRHVATHTSRCGVFRRYPYGMTFIRSLMMFTIFGQNRDEYCVLISGGEGGVVPINGRVGWPVLRYRSSRLRLILALVVTQCNQSPNLLYLCQGRISLATPATSMRPVTVQDSVSPRRGKQCSTVHSIGTGRASRTPQSQKCHVR